MRRTEAGPDYGLAGWEWGKNLVLRRSLVYMETNEHLYLLRFRVAIMLYRWTLALTLWNHVLLFLHPSQTRKANMKSKAMWLHHNCFVFWLTCPQIHLTLKADGECSPGVGLCLYQRQLLSVYCLVSFSNLIVCYVFIITDYCDIIVCLSLYWFVQLVTKLTHINIFLFTKASVCWFMEFFRYKHLLVCVPGQVKQFSKPGWLSLT